MLIKKETAAHNARALLRTEYSAILSTHSQEVAGYPFGSVVPYCLDEQGQPVILISHLAQHTKNIQSNPKVSLTIMQKGVDDVQTAARLSWMGNAEPLVDDAVQQRYYRYFPQARDYHQTHHFDFYRIPCIRGRYVGGFGKIFWLQETQLKTYNPFLGVQETQMIEHMNHDHSQVVKQYCVNMGINTSDHTPTLVGIDGDGFHVLMGHRIVHMHFPEPVNTPEQAREQFIAMNR